MSSLASQQVTLIVDVDDSSSPSKADNLQYSEDPVWYGGNAALINASQSASPTFNMSFNGTSIALYGYALGSTVYLDDETSAQLTASANEATYWYESPPLSDQGYKIRALVGSDSYMDYALIKAGNTTDLERKTIFVDDANEDELWYTGEWIADTNLVYPHGLQNARLPPVYHPANHTVHHSRTLGDSFELRFTGTSLSVYGVHDPSGNYTVDFIMDGSIKRIVYPQVDFELSNSSSRYPQGNLTFGNGDISGWMINYKVYENTTLSPGNHILVVNVTTLMDGSNFYLDYITYTPSFSFIHEKPTFIRGSSSTVSPVTLPIGVIVGIVIASLSVMVIAGGLCYCRRKRSTVKKEGFAADLKPKPTKWRELFPLQDTGSPESTVNELPPLAPMRIPTNMTEVQRRNDEIASLSAQIAGSDRPSRGELYARINTLTMEVDRLVRENAPPEYGGSDEGRRLSSREGTLPSYDHREKL
ncbi:hypothetical protein VNI00_014777 [Paramarasmius palmivorus]|uniref:Transmembrane protein n=1 Tax=Paramarasmius palmivorus TaxID=297713 RepID=A0AAW0BQW7_9AGAR